MIPLEKVRAFKDHPFHLYEGERLDDMVQSARDHGILNPVIVRKVYGGYEMLAGHNRMIGTVLDMYTELQRDDEPHDQLASQDDFDRF